MSGRPTGEGTQSLSDKQTWGDTLLGCGVSSLAVAIVIFFIFVNPLCHPVAEPGPLPDEIPPDVLELRWLGGTVVEGEPYLAQYGQEVHIEVTFEERFSPRRLWSGSQAALLAGNETYAGTTHTETWGSVIWVSGRKTVSDFTPWLRVTFPIEKEHYRKWVDATAEITIVYPAVQETGDFVDKSECLTSGFRFFVLSPDEYSLVKHYKDWQDYQTAQAEKLTRIIAFTVATALGVALVSLGIARKEKRR